MTTSDNHTHSPQTDNNPIPDDQEQIITRFPAGMFNNLEQAVAQEVTIEFLHWLRGIRKDVPEHMRIAGQKIGIGFPKNRMNITWHEGTCRRPKKLAWNVTIELVDYVDTAEPPPGSPTNGGAL